MQNAKVQEEKKKKSILNQDELWHIALQWNSVGIRTVVTSHSLGTAQLPGVPVGNHLEPEHLGFLPAGAICAYSASTWQSGQSTNKNMYPQGWMFSLVCSCCVTSLLPAMYTVLTQEQPPPHYQPWESYFRFQSEGGWALMTAERGEWATTLTFATLLPSDSAPLWTLYEEQLPEEGQLQSWISPQAPLWKKCTLVICRKTTLRSVSLVNEDPTHFSHLHCHSCWVFAALWVICEMSAAHSLQSLTQQRATQHFAALGDHGVTGIYVWAGSGCFFLHSLLQAVQAPCSFLHVLPELTREYMMKQMCRRGTN